MVSRPSSVEFLVPLGMPGFQRDLARKTTSGACCEMLKVDIWSKLFLVLFGHSFLGVHGTERLSRTHLQSVGGTWVSDPERSGKSLCPRSKEMYLCGG